MSLDPFRRGFRQIGVRLIFGFCLLSVISSVGVSFMVYGLFSKSLSQRDHDFISAKGKAYAAVFQRDGLTGLKRNVLEDHLSDFTVRLTNSNAETVFFQAPLNALPMKVTQIEHELQANNTRGWTDLPGMEDDDRLEVLNFPLIDGGQLQVGMSTDNRDDLLERIQRIFLYAFGLTIGLGIVGGYFLSRRVLAPVRDLISTIRTIQAGDLKIRVVNPKTGDELETLISLFNDMLDRIQNLIRGMHETLDNVSHDLKTPLTRFRGSAERALTQPKAGADNYREALSQCVEQSDEIIAMMDSLMDISEAQAGTMKLKKERIATGALISEVRDLYEMVAEEKGVAMEIKCDPDTSVLGDRLRMKQVLANLVDNALKYSAPQSRIQIRAETVSVGVAISVQDSGLGIAQNELTRIWDRLYRVDQSRSTPGLGLGLSLVQSIVRAHGGSVRVESELGRGSKFTVQLPH